MNSDPLIGQQIADQYLIERKLGAGGMGCVYQAKNLKLGGRPCAIKVLLEEVGDSKLGKKRFEEELKIISQLRSPHIVQVTDKGELQGGQLFIVMELLEGEPLSAILAREGPLTLSRTIPIIQGVLAGLSEAHKQGIIHRDLKPANIFITHSVIGYEIAKVLDFGVAKSLGPNAAELTQSQQIMGTPRYMTPEQFLQEPLTPRTDLYATGLLFYEMLSGQPPFMPSSPNIPKEVKSLPEVVQLMWLHLNGEVPKLKVPLPIWELCASLLAKKQEDRPHDATLIIQRLNELKGLPVERDDEEDEEDESDSDDELSIESDWTAIELIEAARASQESGAQRAPARVSFSDPPSPPDHFNPLKVRSGVGPSYSSYASAPSLNEHQGRSFLPEHAVTRVGTDLELTQTSFSIGSQARALFFQRYVILGGLSLIGGVLFMMSLQRNQQPTPESTAQVIRLSNPSPVPLEPTVIDPPNAQLIPIRPPTSIELERTSDHIELSPVEQPPSQSAPRSAKRATKRGGNLKANRAKSKTSKRRRTKSRASKQSKPKRAEPKIKRRAVPPNNEETPATVTLKLMSPGVFFMPGSRLKIKSTVTPTTLSEQIRYVIHPKGAATVRSDELVLSSQLQASIVRIKACVQRRCSLPIKVRIGAEEAPE